MLKYNFVFIHPSPVLRYSPGRERERFVNGGFNYKVHHSSASGVTVYMRNADMIKILVSLFVYTVSCLVNGIIPIQNLMEIAPI
jgi:hypothetical protein